MHYSSGPANHFFYLLAEGSGAKTINGIAYNSPTCNGSTVTGIGRDAAAKIWYRALTVYMTSSTNYAGARVADVNAATDLYGATSTAGRRGQGGLVGGRRQLSTDAQRGTTPARRPVPSGTGRRCVGTPRSADAASAAQVTQVGSVSHLGH